MPRACSLLSQPDWSVGRVESPDLLPSASLSFRAMVVRSWGCRFSQERGLSKGKGRVV